MDNIQQTKDSFESFSSASVKSCDVLEEACKQNDTENEGLVTEHEATLQKSVEQVS